MKARSSYRAASLLFSTGLLASSLYAQEGSQPPPFTVPTPPLPSATMSPGQEPVPAQQKPQVAPDAPLPRNNETTVDLRNIAPLATQPSTPASPSTHIHQAGDLTTRPSAESYSRFNTQFFNLITPYRAPSVPQFRLDSTQRISSLVRDGKLYLSLHDAIALAIENNLDVEVTRYNLSAADTDATRAQGGGNLRGIDYTVQQTPNGVGSLTSPLLVTATTGTNTSTNVNVTDLSQVTQSGTGAQQNLSENGASTYSAGPPIPLYDPTLSGQAGYLRRSDTQSLTSLSGTSTTSNSNDSTSTAPLDYVNAGVDYQQGFSPGTQLDAYIDNSSQVLYADNSQRDPFHAPSASLTVTQPLLRGLGREVNQRFIRIARLDQKVSLLLFEQQLLETVYGVSRLYFDLVSLGENVGVKEQALAAAQRLYDDDKNQVDQGTLAPIELTRAQTLLSSSRLDLIQARGEYRQQEVILKEQLVRSMGDPSAQFASLIPTDQIKIPEQLPAIDTSALIADALRNRPDLAQASIQIKADEVAVRASRNNVKPLLNAYANAQTRGSSLVPYETLGSTGTGAAIVPPELTQGGLRTSTIFQGGVQLSLPLRNRIAQADAARDAIQLRQAEGRSIKLENDIRQQVENSTIALETAHQAYAAAVESSNYQQQLLQAEVDKFAVGESTNYLIIQDQAYLSQARSTEVAARSDWMKAQLSLDRALGNLLEKNSILFEDAVRGQVK